MGAGAITLAVAVLAVLAWAAYLVNASRVRRRQEPPPANLTIFLTDDELESKRLNGVLVAALVVAALLAVVIPVYYLSESSRQVAAEHRFEEIAVERGHHWYEEFGCGGCHGIDGGGGAASFVEPRSGLETSWAAPSINDVLYRYSEDETRYWLVYGRAGTPMPAWGVEGGGPLNTQQIEELIAYLDEIKISQAESVAQIDSRVSLALSALDSADATMEAAITRQRDRLAALDAAPEKLALIGDSVERFEAIVSADDSCTVRSAALVDEPCDDPAQDRDRDGIADRAEDEISALLSRIVEIAPVSEASLALDVTLEPNNAFSVVADGEPQPDFDTLELLYTDIQTVVRDLDLTTRNMDRLRAAAEQGLDFLLEAQEQRRWVIDFERIADAGFDGDVEQARRAAGLYQAYCARCHTAGYSAGIPYTLEPGSGAFGPSLREGRSTVQFPDFEDHVDFIVNGSENGQAYGVNGIGRGWMPGFGSSLPLADIELIVQFERVLE